MTAHHAPDLLPVLTPGRHRSPRRGACFMEFASFLAGEKWGDDPRCTDPALAHLARMVNDTIPARDRASLVSLIPSVIGAKGDETRIGVLVAVRAAEAALPIAAETRQRALAAGLLSLRDIARVDDSDGDLRRRIRTALDTAPHAERWARSFRTLTAPARADDLPRMVDAIVQLAVIGIAEACVHDSGERMRDLLAGAIDDARAVAATTSGAERTAEPVLPETAPVSRRLLPTR
jgi:hypothetical protein